MSNPSPIDALLAFVLKISCNSKTDLDLDILNSDLSLQKLEELLDGCGCVPYSAGSPKERVTPKCLRIIVRFLMK